MRNQIATLTLLLATTISAYAADVIEAPADVIKAPADVASAPLPERFGWTGVYLGASVGHAWMKDVDQAPPGGLPAPFHDKGNDWNYGGHVGFLYQFDNNLVLGAELEHLQLGVKFENLAKYGVDIETTSSTTPSVRLGYGYDRFLVSGHVGASYVRTEAFGKDYLKDWGWAAGAGLDYAFTDNLTAGVHYTHSQFDKFDGSQIDAKLDVLTARMGYKF